MNAVKPSIVLLPGLGADERPFAAQREAFPDLVTPPWIAPRANEGLTDYADRFAAEITVSRPLVLGGCSLGGMIAYEMARSLQPEALVLIASAVIRETIPLHLRTLARIAWIVPPAGYGLSKLFWPVIGPVFGGRKAEHRRMVVGMLRATSPRFLRWSCMAVGGWKPRPPSGVRTFVIHGSKDRVLPLGKGHADYEVAGAGHLLAVTHSSEVNAALQDIVDRVANEAMQPRAADMDRSAQER